MLQKRKGMVEKRGKQLPRVPIEDEQQNEDTMMVIMICCDITHITMMLCAHVLKK